MNLAGTGTLNMNCQVLMLENSFKSTMILGTHFFIVALLFCEGSIFIATVYS